MISFFLSSEEGTLKRKLAIWDHQSKKKPPKMKLMIHYAGEDGIDTGAITKEYLSETTLKHKNFGGTKFRIFFGVVRNYFLPKFFENRVFLFLFVVTQMKIYIEDQFLGGNMWEKRTQYC